MRRILKRCCASFPLNSGATSSWADQASVCAATGKETGMTAPTRRSLIRGSLGLAAAATLGRPYTARAEAKTATVWWTQGFAEEEDIAFKKIVSDYEKASGNVIDTAIIPYAPMRQKIVSAVT